MKNKYCFVLLVFAGLFSGMNSLNKTDLQVQAYVKKHTVLAQKESAWSQIPVSIILGQAILESRFGTSDLAIKANNHFGIKCKIDWKGETVLADDDHPEECFRKYQSVEDSYKDYANFIKNNRLHFYDHLFEIDKRDYKAWAIGLQQAGYATTDYYAKTLVYLIEHHQLYELDGSSLGWRLAIAQRSGLSKKAQAIYKVSLYDKKNKSPVEVMAPREQNVVQVHTVKKGDSMESIAKRYKLDLDVLYDYNQMIWGSQPEIGTTVYLNYRSNKAPKLRAIDYFNKKTNGQSK